MVVSIGVQSRPAERDNNQGDLEDFFRYFGERGSPAPRQATGSGVIFSSDGYIITNNHVIEDAADGGILVTTSDRREFKATLIGRDPLTDLAVIKINADDMPVTYIGNSDNVEVGQWSLAVGNPLGLNSTVTAGIISAIGRGGLGLSRDSFAVENFLQTDAAINPGNSGGGLFDLRGRLIGINTAIATRTGSYVGYGFAIPANLVKAVVKDLIEDGRVNRGYIGVSIQTVDEPLAKALGLSNVTGVLVQNVLEGMAASSAGIAEGDVILELDNKKVTSSQELQSLVALRRAGQSIRLKIWRDGKELIKNVTLRSRDGDETLANATPGEPEPVEENISAPITFENIGFTVAGLNDTVKENVNVEDGVVVTEIQPYSLTARRGSLSVGDVIVKADKKLVKSPRQFKSIIEKVDPGDAVLLQIKTQNGTRIVGLEIPTENG